MIESVTSGASPSAAGTAASAAPTPNALANKETFLKLLVAQIKNQNPMNPADGIQFLSQLAQFTQLEQLIEVRGELETIRRAITEPPPESGAASNQES